MANKKHLVTVITILIYHSYFDIAVKQARLIVANNVLLIALNF